MSTSTNPISMYQASVPIFVRTLGSLKTILKKAARHAEAKNIAPADLLHGRLAPDMYSLRRQVQSAADIAKACVARLAGVEPPVDEDNEASFDELIARVDRTIALIKGYTAEQIDGSEERIATLGTFGGPVNFKGQVYLTYYALPNFFFHVVSAYNILRHNGVALGKLDFLGAP